MAVTVLIPMRFPILTSSTALISIMFHRPWLILMVRIQNSPKRQKQLSLEDYVIRRDPPSKEPKPLTTPTHRKHQKRINSYMSVTKSPSRTESPKSKNPYPTDNGSTTEAPSFTSVPSSMPPSSSFSTVSHTTTPGTSFGSIHLKPPAPKFPITKLPVRNGPLTEAKVEKEVRDLVVNGPFSSKHATCSNNFPLRYRYEAERVARACRVSSNVILPGNTLQTDQSYDSLWQTICRVPYNKPLEKTKQHVWKLAVGQYKDPDTHMMVVLSGNLEWKNGELLFTLNPLKLDKSHRFARRFGADRFLEVTLPSKHPDKSNAAADIYRTAVATWLTCRDHHILGRDWRAFFVEDYKSNSKAGYLYKAFMFAVDGADFLKSCLESSISSQMTERHPPMTVEQLFNWHIPIHRNGSQQDMKLFNRLRLGLSRTNPSVTLLPEEIIFDDNPRQELMSDGCALMSRSLGEAISKSLSFSTVPACFQGRFAGSKGIWVVAKNDDVGPETPVKPSATFATERNYWIVINASQLKVKPPPCDRSVQLDEHQLTFDVCSWAKPLKPVDLNIQFLMVLKNGGIEKEYLASIVKNLVDTYFTELLEILTKGDSEACRIWMKRVGGLGASTSKLADGFPIDIREQINMLLDAGFLPSKLHYLRLLFQSCLDKFFKTLGNLKIQIPLSTYAYCIPDPYGILKEGEVYIAFGDEWEGGALDLDGIEVLVARAPAHLPADVQKCRAVFYSALRHLKNVIVFPTTGDRPLASMLSGGDYDGDKVWVCWDPQLVAPFRNQPFHDTGKPEQYGLLKVSKPVNGQRFDDFMVRAFRFNLLSSPLGQCTNDHERFCYFWGGIGFPGAIEYSCLLSHLVDTKKSGYEYPRENQRAFRSSLGKATDDNPAYKDPDVRDWKPDDIGDYLKFEVIKEETVRIQQLLHKESPSSNIYKVDDDLLAPWKTVWNLAIDERSASNSAVLLDAIQKIGKEVERAYDTWISARSNASLSYEGYITLASESLMAIPPPKFEHERSAVWTGSEYEWKVFLASCAYEKSSSKGFPWYAAAGVLCEIKCKAMGTRRCVTSVIYQLLEVNNLRAKKVEANRRKAEAKEAMENLTFMEDTVGSKDDDDGSDDEDARWASLL